MKRKGWVIPILVFIISFSALSFYQKNQDSVSIASTTELPPIIWSKSPSNINKIAYSYGDQTITAIRQDQSFYLPDFNNTQADDFYIYSILDHFTQPLFDKVIEVEPKDLSTYGIDDSCATLTLYDNEGVEYTIMKGNAVDDTLDYVYAPISNTVYAMDHSIFENLTTSEVAWLNKQLLNFNKEDVTKISFSYKSLQATLTPTILEDGTITFTSNNINDSLAAEFVHFLETTKIEQFITNQATTHVLEVYGFSNPSLKCTIYLNTGNTITLTIGNINQSENICYAMVNQSGQIAAIPFFDFSQFSSMYAQLHESNSTQLG